MGVNSWSVLVQVGLEQWEQVRKVFFRGKFVSGVMGILMPLLFSLQLHGAVQRCSAN